MRLEDQVVSLELAKKLKELGVKQESLFWWNEYEDFDSDDWRNYRIKNYRKRTELRPYGIENTSYPECGEAIKNAARHSAFTVAELGEMLPSGFKSGRADCIANALPPLWFCRDSEETHQQIASTEADARAKMLIYLLENKLITP